MNPLIGLIPLSALVIAMAFCRCLFAWEAAAYTIPVQLISVKFTILLLAIATGVARLLWPPNRSRIRWLIEAIWLACAIALAWTPVQQTVNWAILGWLTLAQVVDLTLDGFLEDFLMTWRSLWREMRQ